MINLKQPLEMVLRHRVTALLAFVFAFVVVASASIATGAREDRTVAAERPRGCCVRSGDTADSASAEFQQALSTAIVQSGAELQDFSAPRPVFGEHMRRLTSIVRFRGEKSAVIRALGRIALLEPQVAVASAQLDHTGADMQARLYLVQWVRLPE